MAKAKALTDAGVKRFSAASSGKRVDHPDQMAPGLFLRINDKGRKSWMVHFRVNGRQGKLALGTWPTMELDEARKLSRWAREVAKSGVHPRVERARKEVEDKLAAGEQFANVIEDYIEAAKSGKLLGARKRPITIETAIGRESRLRRLILPEFGNRPIKEISTSEISYFLSRVEAESGPVDRCLQDIRLIFRFATSRGWFQGSPPTAGLSNRQAPQAKSRVLEDWELRSMWQAAIAYGYPFGPATQLLMLTGQRRDEIGDMKWSDINLERQLLTIPESRNKNRKGDHEVPLSEAAIVILEEVRKIAKALRIESEFVFTNTGDTPISGWSKAGPRLDRYMRMDLADITEEEKAVVFYKGQVSDKVKRQKDLVREKLNQVDLSHWRFHDLRHTLITRLRDGEENEHGETIFAIPLDVVQQIVNHEITAGVTSVYDHGDIERRYRLRKREALEWWGRKLTAIVAHDEQSDNVVNLRRVGL